MCVVIDVRREEVALDVLDVLRRKRRDVAVPVDQPVVVVVVPVGPCVLEQTRIERFAFCSLPPFVPKQAGRRPTFQSGPTISVRGVMHTLTHSRNVMKSGTSERMWKNEDGRCVCCYAATPSLTASEREANPNRRKKVRKTRYACDKCLVLLCTDCFHNDWSLHKKKPCPIAVRSVYV